MPAPQLKLTTNRKSACGRALRGLEFGTLTLFQGPLAPDAAKPRPPLSQAQELARKFLPGRLLDRRHQRRRAASFALVPCETIPF